MESKVEKNFKNTIGKIFGEDGWNDIKLLYEKVILEFSLLVQQQKRR